MSKTDAPPKLGVGLGLRLGLDVTTSSPDDERQCDRCGEWRARAIRRINMAGRPVLCDECFEQC